MKSTKLNLLTRIKLNFQLIGNSLINSFSGAAILFAFAAPYLHMFLNKTSTEKVFGFLNMQSFMYAIGLPSSLMVCSCLLLHLSFKVKQRTVYMASFLFLYSSFFQFIWIFWYEPDLPKSLYFISVALGSLVASYLIYLIFRYQKKKEQQRLKKEQETERFERNTIELIKSLKSKVYPKQ